MSEINENENNITNHKRKKRKLKSKLNEEGEEEEENEIKIRKKKKRSKTTRKVRINYGNYIEDNENENEENENEEKPKRKKRRKKKKETEIEGEEEKNINNDEENEDEEKPKKKKRKRRKKPQTDDENDNSDKNENEEEDKVKWKSKSKKRKKRKNEENEENEENENNEENEIGSSIKKKKKKRLKNKLEDDNDNNNNDDKNTFFSSNDVKLKFYKTAKNLIKKKKKKKSIRKEEDEEEQNKPKLAGKLRTKKKKTNILLADKIKSNDNNINEEDEKEDDDDNNDEPDINNFDNLEEKWPSIKKEFLTTIENYLNEIRLYEFIDIAIVSTICLTKKEYGNIKLTNHHDIYPIKNYNNINWVKEPYQKVRNKFYELSAPGHLIANNNNLDFSNRVCNEYEIYNAQVQLIKASGNDITDKIKPESISFFPKEQDKIIKKPYLLLFFSFNEEKSILFYKEVLEYLKENKDKFIFIPIYAPLIQVEKNIYFVTEMLYRYKVYKKGDKFDIYFCSNDAMSKRFKYISEDNRKIITCKTAFIDLINNQFIVKAVRDLDSFTFNLIDSHNQINKEKYQMIKKNLQNFKKNSTKKLKNTSLIEPYNCNWILKKAKIYTILKAEKKLKLKYTLYDSLSGVTNCSNLYKSEVENQNLCKILNKLFCYKLRLNPKIFKLTNKQINKLIIEEMYKCTEGKKEFQNITYQGIFQTQKIIMSLGSEFDIEQKFEPIKTKSFKLEIHIDYNLFDELNPMKIIGSLYGLTLFTYFNNCDYICCLPKIGNTFPDKLILTDSKTLNNVEVSINPQLNKPTLLITFSLAFQNYFASSELSSRFKLIIKKLRSFFNNINVILIYRGEPSLFNQRFEQIKDEQIFNFDFPLYIQSSADMKFPLIYQNNDIESTDSQIMTFILNKKNKLVYTGNLEEIELDKTFQKLRDDYTGKIDDILVYKEHANLTYDNFKKMIKPTIKIIEEIIEKEIKKENSLLYRPFFSLSYNSFTNFENYSTDNEKYINHIRLRILLKQKHENIYINNKEFKNIITELKKYGASTIIMNIPCEDIEFLYHCDKCEKKIIDIDENNPVYYDEESKKIFCEKCGNEFSRDIKNDTFVTFFNTKNYNDEVISEMYENYNKRDAGINPILGNTCKICENKIGECYYLNLTNFNIDYIESPLTPIDICEFCFDTMRKGDPFLKEPLKRLNYEKFGLNYKQMIYRKIFIPLIE